mmetsp:Transcript_79856/g.230831  ORF Transcript_79856/g.230831 Transcript_79856/m.230831 type:complete len:205 (+) Transcript_79856:56-670(+)
MFIHRCCSIVPCANETDESSELFSDDGDNDIADEVGPAAELLAQSPRALANSFVEGLARRHYEPGDDGDVEFPLRMLVSRLPHRDAAEELLKLASCDTEPFKTDIQVALAQCGAIAALVRVAHAGPLDVRDHAVHALSAIACRRGCMHGAVYVALVNGAPVSAPSTDQLWPNSDSTHPQAAHRMSLPVEGVPKLPRPVAACAPL